MEKKSEDSFSLEEDFLSMDEGTHPRASAIAAYYKMLGLTVKFKERRVDEQLHKDTFKALKEIVEAEQARRPRAAGRGVAAATERDPSIAKKLDCYDRMVQLLNGYQEYPRNNIGAELEFWNSLCNILGI